MPPSSLSSARAAGPPLSVGAPCGWAQGMAALLGRVQSRGVPISSLAPQASLAPCTPVRHLGRQQLYLGSRTVAWGLVAAAGALQRDVALGGWRG